jgi:hypothetical protein
LNDLWDNSGKSKYITASLLWGYPAGRRNDIKIAKAVFEKMKDIENALDKLKHNSNTLFFT